MKQIVFFYTLMMALGFATSANAAETKLDFQKNGDAVAGKIATTEAQFFKIAYQSTTRTFAKLACAEDQRTKLDQGLQGLCFDIQRSEEKASLAGRIENGAALSARQLAYSSALDAQNKINFGGQKLGTLSFNSSCDVENDFRYNNNKFVCKITFVNSNGDDGMSAVTYLVSLTPKDNETLKEIVKSDRLATAGIESVFNLKIDNTNKFSAD